MWNFRKQGAILIHTKIKVLTIWGLGAKGYGMKNILVVDDNLKVRETLEEALIEAGYNVKTAIDGLDAMEYIKKYHFDLLITDIVMPNMDGIGIIMTLAKEYPYLKIIAISGGGFIKPESYLDMARTLGVKHALAKPIQIDELLTSMDDLLEVTID